MWRVSFELLTIVDLFVNYDTLHYPLQNAQIYDLLNINSTENKAPVTSHNQDIQYLLFFAEILGDLKQVSKETLE